MVDKADSGHVSTGLRDRPELQCVELGITPQMIEAGSQLVCDWPDFVGGPTSARDLFQSCSELLQMQLLAHRQAAQGPSKAK